MFRDFVRVVCTILRKDLRVWIQQPINMAATFVPALGLLLVTALGSATVGKSPVALVTLDHGSKGAQMQQIFHDDNVFRITDSALQQAQVLFKNIDVDASNTYPSDLT